MADRDDEEILRIIMEKGSDKAKKAAADALAQQPPTPADPPEVKPIKTRKRRKGLKSVAAKIGNSKYYYNPEGAIVDENGQPAPERIAKMLLQKNETADAIKGHLTKIKPNLAKTEKAITEKQQREVNTRIERLGKVTENTIATNNAMMNRVPVAFTEFQNVLDNFATQNNMLLDSLTKQNDEFQEKIMEMLTGIKAPTKSSGEKKGPTLPKKSAGSKKGKVTRSAPTTKRVAPAKKPRTSSRYQQRVAAMSDEQKVAQGQKVQERAERIGQIRTQRNIGMVAAGIGVGAVGGAAAAYGAYKLFAGDNKQNIPTPQTENLDDGTKRSTQGTAPDTGTGPTGAAGGSLFQQQPSAPPPAGAPPAQQQQQQGGTGTPSKTPGMTTLKTPGGKAFDVAAPYAANFQGFVNELENSGYKIKSIGGYANRNIAGTGTKSYHSLGVAIDINPSQNPHLFDGRTVTDMPSNVGAMAAKYGLGWGGNWRSSKDTMHFSMAKGEGGSVAVDRSGATPLPGAPGAPTEGFGAPGAIAAGTPQAAPSGGGFGAGGAIAAGTPQKTTPDVGTAGAGAAPGEVVKVVEAGAGYNVVQLADGSTERRDGARNWRNNNPGNIQYGDFAKRFGALGSDGRFAIFPSYDAGRKAKEALLFEGRGYAGMNIQQAIYRYAPPNENNSQNYVNTVANAVGVPASTPLSQLNAQQRVAMLNAMEKVEGFRTGRVTRQNGPTGAPTTAVAAAGAANEAAAAGTPTKAEAPTAVSAAGAANQAATAQMTGEKPANVTFESGKVDISKVDPKLLQGLFAAAKEYGKPVRINSAYRGDEYQAQLWVRGRILKEPGIHIPAAPEKTTTITYKGQTYTVPGSGRGSAHGRGQAIDISPGVGSDFQGILAKYGITYPFGASDPPHIQLAGGSSYTPPAGGEPAPGTAVANAPTAPTTVAGAALANASAERAIQQGTAPTGVQQVIVNNTQTVNNTRFVRTGSSIPSGCECRPGGFNPLAMVAGAALGKALRLF
jgi:uncharacterized protein YcbK (DUF882 family)